MLDKTFTSTLSGLETFQAAYKVHPCIASEKWKLESQRRFSRHIKPKHLLWALHFMKAHSPQYGERIMAAVMKCDRKTFRKYVWPVMEHVAKLRCIVVSFALFFLEFEIGK